MGRSQLVALALLCFLQIGANALWLQADAGVQFTDAAYHYSQVLDLRAAVLGGSEGLTALAEQDERQRYGGLGYALAVLVSLATGPEAGPLLLGLSFLLWPALLLGAYSLGSVLAPPAQARSAGLLAAGFSGFIPGLFNYSRVLVLDLMLTVLVLGASVLILRLHSRPSAARASFESWALVGTLLMILALKVNGLVFVVGLSLGLYWPQVREALASGPRSVARRIGVGLLLLGPIGIWLLFGRRGDALRETLSQSTWPGALLLYSREGSLAEFPGDYLSYVWGRSWEMAYYTLLQSFTPLLFVPILLAYLWYFGRERGCRDALAHRQRAGMFGWLVLPVLALLFGLRGLYDERYLLPLLPQAGALVAVALVELPWPRLRGPLCAALLGAASLNFTVVSFDALPSIRPGLCAELPGWSDTERVGGQLWTCALYSDYRFMDRTTRPDARTWAKEELRAVLQPERDRLSRPLHVVFFDDLYDLFYRVWQQDLLQQDLYRHEDLLLVTRCWDEAWARSVWGSVEELKQTVAGADVALVRWGATSHAEDSALRGRRCTLFDKRNFELESELPLEDGTSLRIYFRR